MPETRLGSSANSTVQTFPSEIFKANPSNVHCFESVAGFCRLVANGSRFLAKRLVAVKPTTANDQLDFGCVANRGWFAAGEDGSNITDEGVGSTASFLFHLISTLQQLGTVPMIDMAAYARHLKR